MDYNLAYYIMLNNIQFNQNILFNPMVFKKNHLKNNSFKMLCYLNISNNCPIKL